MISKSCMNLAYRYFMNSLDKFNPKLILVNHIGKGNMPSNINTFGTRTTRWHELDIIIWGDGCDHVCGEDFSVTAGDIFYRTPGLCNKHDLPYHCYFFVFDPYYDEANEPAYLLDPLNGDANETDKTWCPIPSFSFAKKPYLGKAKDLEKLNSLCMDIMIEYSCANPDPRALKILFLRLVREVANQMNNDEEAIALLPCHQQYWQVIQDIKRWIRDNPTAQFSMETMANRLNVSYSFFSRLFKNITNEKFSNYVIRMKLNYVKIQLMDTNKSIAEIALECGFSDPNYLYILFQRELGCTPTEYRTRTAYGRFNE